MLDVGPKLVPQENDLWMEVLSPLFHLTTHNEIISLEDRTLVSAFSRGPEPNFQVSPWKYFSKKTDDASRKCPGVTYPPGKK